MNKLGLNRTLLLSQIICGILFSSIYNSFAQFAPKANIITRYEIENIKAINGIENDFSPVLYNGRLIFTSFRDHNLVNYGENRYEKTPYELIYFSLLQTTADSITYQIPKLFGSSIAVFDPTGPICFSKQGNKAFFTMKNSLKKKSKPQLYSAKIDKKGNISKAKPLNINKKKTTFQHPTISDDGEYLFFSSDRDDGFGGLDIYVSEKKSDGWKDPVNLGAAINTAGDEVFPCLYKDSTLYFSSNGRQGMGGLDIFSSKKANGEWTLPTPLDSAINSTSHDYGIFFNEDGKTGYFSSNRDGGMGMADIYSFSVKHIEQIPTTSLSGKFNFRTLSTKVPEGLKVYLIDDKGEIAYTTIIDNEGRFKFQKLPYNENFMIKIDEENPPIDLFLLHPDSSENNIIAELMNNKKGIFVFKKLTNQQLASLEFIQADDPKLEIEQQKGHLVGQFNYNKLQTGTFPSGGLKVYLVNENGDIMHTTLTDVNGKFVFENLSMNNNYIVKIDEYDPNIELLILSGGDKVATLTNDDKGNFIFVKMKFDAVNNIALLTIEDAPIVFAETEITKEELSYVFLKTSTKDTLSLKEELDTKLEPITEEVEKKDIQTQTIYYDIGSSYFAFKDTLIFNQLILLLKEKPTLKMEINSYADTRESDTYNIWLTERRVNRIKEYFIHHGISVNRINGKGYGESYVAVECDECTEEQHQQNRRTVIKLYE